MFRINKGLPFNDWKCGEKLFTRVCKQFGFFFKILK